MENPKEYELRMDMLALVEFLLNQDILTETLTFYSEVVLKMILIPATVWKVGSPNVKVRKASVICMMRMVDNKILSKGKLKNNFMEVINVLKGCLDDDWATDIRFTGVVFVRKIIEYLHEELESEDYKEIYPELLKRLDDSQDGIRIATAEAFCIFFKYLPNPWSVSLYDYTIKTIFIHLDDQNPQIQKAIRGVLLAAARVQTEKFMEIAEEQVGKFQHTSVISGLIEEARKLLD